MFFFHVDLTNRRLQEIQQRKNQSVIAW
jgi:hypothetical protein